MKNIAKYLGIASLAVLMAGCTDEDLFENKMPVSGEEVVFGSQVEGYSLSKQGRTVYGVDSDWDGDLSGVNHLLINWVDGDKVWIGCEQAMTGYQQASYQVDAPDTPLNPGDKNHNKSLLVKLGDTGIRWGDATQEHKFYAFYPQDKMVKMEGSKVTLTIPQTQDRGRLLTSTEYPNIIRDPNWKIVNPDMGFAMMVGWGKWTPGETETPEVRLNFQPITTVLDVLVNGPKEGTPMGVYSVMVQSDSRPIVGTFTVDIATTDNTGSVFPADGTNTTATVVCSQQKEDGTIEPVYLNPGEQLNLKFFLLPRDYEAGSLKISVLTDGGQVLTKTLTPTDAEGNATTGVTLKAGEITRVSLPKMKYAPSSNWMSLIDDNVYIDNLSLPGSKHSYSYSLFDESNNASATAEKNIMLAYQKLDMLEQFNKGIRAFDLKVTAESSTATPQIFMAAGKTTMPLFDFLAELKDRIENGSVDAEGNPTEGAVLSMGYVQLGSESCQRWADNLLGLLATWNAENGNILVPVNSEYTMGDLRGKIGLLINPDGTITNAHPEIANVIQEYSSAVHNATLRELNEKKVLVQNLLQVNNPDITDGEGTYAVRTGLGLLPYSVTDPDRCADNALYQVPDLINRKLTLVEEILARATSDKEQGKRCLYINDLGGFCVVKSDDGESTGWMAYQKATCGERPIFGGYRWNYDSSWGTTTTYHAFDYNTITSLGCDYVQTEEPAANADNVGKTLALLKPDFKNVRGEGGNSALLAEKINPKVNGMIYNLVAGGQTPLGIVYMNYAGVDQVEYKGRTYNVQGATLPGLILSNNFKMQLDKKPTTGQ